MVHFMMLFNPPGKARVASVAPRRCGWTSHLILIFCYAAIGCLLFQISTFVFSCLAQLRIPITITKHSSQLLSNVKSFPPPCPVEYAGAHVVDEFNGPNDFIIYRSIGNDLPPRHAASQSYNNVKFILEHEPTLPGLDKGWIINKIANKTEEQRLIRLLESYGQKYEVIPLDLDQAAKVPIHYTGFHFHDVLRRNLNVGQGLRAIMYRASVIDHIYRDKNIFVINNNGARNKALEAGIQGGYKWILPWDGNCFLTSAGWKTMRETVMAKANRTKYFHVPMARVMDNAVLFDPTYCPEPVEEPQLIFRYDAQARFSEQQRYGRRPKVDMIMRLGIPGPWDDYVKYSAPYFETPYTYTIESDVGPDPVPVASWVARLYSGRGKQEVATKDSADLRKLARCQGVHLLLDQVDAMAVEQSTGFNAMTLMFWNETVLAKEKNAYLSPGAQNKDLKQLVDKVVECANRAVEYRPMGRDDIKPKGPIKVDSTTYDKPGEILPSSRFSALTGNTTCLALAYYFTDVHRYAVASARNLAAFFMDSDTSLRPEEMIEHLIGPESDTATNQSIVGSIEAREFFTLMDAIKITAMSGVLTKKEFALLQNWFQVYADTMMWRVEGSMLGIQSGTDYYDSRGVGPRGVDYDIQLGAVAALAGNTTLALHHIKHSRARLQQQFALREAPNPYPNIPNQFYGAIRYKRINVVEDVPWSLRQLVSWNILGRVGLKVGQDLFAYTHVDTPNLPILRGAASLWLPGFESLYTHNDIPAGDPYSRKMAKLRKRLHQKYTPTQRPALALMHHTAMMMFNDMAALNVTPPCELYKCPSDLVEEYGVPAFWNLGFTDRFIVS